MRAQWRNALRMFEHGLVVLSMAVTMGVAFAQAGPVFAVSAALGAGAHNVSRVSRTPEKIAFQSALVVDVMAFAYGFPLDRIERRPQWAYDDFYDVAVTTAAPASLPEQKLLLQKLLEERFGLVVHRTSNPSPVYYLVRGAKVNLTEAKEGDSEDIPSSRCVGPTPQQAGISSAYRLGVCVFGPASMSDLADWLYPQLGLPVLDKTGLAGLFDIEMPRLPRGGAERTIQAVRNSLGLDLQVHQGTAESLIIDHVEKPSRN